MVFDLGSNVKVEKSGRVASAAQPQQTINPAVAYIEQQRDLYYNKGAKG